MAEGKKSFILYIDLIHTIESLEDIEAGKLFKHLLRYVNDLNPTAPDRIIQLVFEPIKQQLKRDLKDWQKEITGKSEGGKKSAEIRKNLKLIKDEVSILKSVQHTSTNSTVNVNVNDSVNVTVNDNVINDYKLKIESDVLVFENAFKIHNCTENGFKDIVSAFFTRQKADGKNWETYNECKKHFNNWLNKYIPPKQIEVKVKTPKFKMASDD